jgi:Anti-sigma-K factor rskA/Sigma-70, region 4
MATFDQLSAEQRAIVELVLRQSKSYEELAGMLGIPEARVRELARDALVDLAPVSAGRVEEDWRGQLVDYVLGQQSGPEATATKGHLRRSEAARTWTSSLLDSLEQLYQNGSLPAIPEGERGARLRAPRRAAAAGASSGGSPGQREPGPEARAAVRRRRIVAAGAGVALLLVIVLLWPIGLLTGDGDGDGSQASGSQGGDGRAASGRPAGIAVVAEQNGRRQLIVQAASLAPSGRREAYEVWLYNSPEDAKSVGAQVTDARGTYQGAGPLPANFEKYRFIDVSREPIDRNAAHSGESVLRGRVPKLRRRNAQGDRAAILGQVVLTPPQGG